MGQAVSSCARLLRERGNVISSEILWSGSLAIKIPHGSKLHVHEEGLFKGLIARIAAGRSGFLLYVQGDPSSLKQWVQPKITLRGDGALLSQVSEHGGTYASILLNPVRRSSPDHTLYWYNGSLDYKPRAHMVFELPLTNSEGGIQIAKRM